MPLSQNGRPCIRGKALVGHWNFTSLESSSSVIRPDSESLGSLFGPIDDPVHARLHQPFRSSLPSSINRAQMAISVRGWDTASCGVFTSHTWQDILACTQRDKEREGNKPDTNAKVRSNLGEGGYIRGHVAIVARRGRGRRVRKVAEPQDMVDED